MERLNLINLLSFLVFVFDSKSRKGPISFHIVPASDRPVTGDDKRPTSITTTSSLFTLMHLGQSRALYSSDEDDEDIPTDLVLALVVGTLIRQEELLA